MNADELNGCTDYQIVSQDLIIGKMCTKMVPKNLNENLKVYQNHISAEKLEWLETEPDFLNWVITGDESWFF
jgi:hypothetical protein